MSKVLMPVLIAGGLVAAAFPFTEARATNRTYISSSGSDANPCYFDQPCSSFSRALAETDPGGEIMLLDSSSNFGSAQITKSVSIIADHVYGGIAVHGSYAIHIDAPNAVVRLRGLRLFGHGDADSGIRIVRAGNVHIDDVIIRRFNQNVRSTNGGIEIAPTSGSARVTIVNTTVNDNVRGIMVHTSGAATASVVLDRVIVKGNGGTAIGATGTGSTVRVNQSVITHNSTGLSRGSGGVIYSYGNNVIDDNTSNGTPTSVVSLK